MPSLSLHSALYSAPYYAGASTMRLENAAGDHRDFPVPVLGGGNPTSYEYICDIGGCVPASWLTSRPYTLTVDIFNDVPENNEWNNTAVLGGVAPTPLPCGATETPAVSPTPTLAAEPELAIMQYVIDTHPAWNCSAVGGTPGHRTLGCYTGVGHTGSGIAYNFNDPALALADWQQRHDQAQSFYPIFRENPWNGYSGYHAEGEVPPYNFFTHEEYYAAGVRVLGGIMVDDTGYHYAPEIATAIMVAAQQLGYLPYITPTPVTSVTPTPTPSCCTGLEATASTICLWQGHAWISGGVTNSCPDRVLGSVDICVQVATNPWGPWTQTSCDQHHDTYFEVGNNSWSGEGWPFPSGYSYYMVRTTASSADGCWQSEVTTTPIPICWEATPGVTITPIYTVTHTATPTSTPTPPYCAQTFPDVQPGSTFYAYITCLSCRGIVSGYPNGYFYPAYPLTRGQLSKIVSNSAGYSEVFATNTFEDVPAGSTFFQFVERLYFHGAIQGYPCGGPGEPCTGPANRPYFRPSANVTRGQTAKVVAVAVPLGPAPPGSQTFQDVPVGGTFWEWVEALAAIDAIGGYPCGGPGEPCVAPENRPYFRPNSGVTRAQASKIVVNAFFPLCTGPSRK